MANRWIKADILIRIPLVLYGAGFIIHTAYLSQFNIFESDLLQSRYIFSGTMAILFIGICIWFNMISMNLKAVGDNFNPFRLIAWAGRICVFAVASYYLLQGGSKLFNEIPFEMKPISVGILNQVSEKLIFLAFLNIFFNAVMPNYNKADLFWDKIFKRIHYIFSPIYITIAVFAAFSNPTFFDILKMVIFIAGFVFFGMLGYRDAKHGFVSAYLDETEEPQNQRQVIRKFAPVFALIALLSCLYSYGQLIYPILSSNLGGAKPVFVRLTMENEVIEGYLLSEGSDWITISTSDSADVCRYNIDSIQQIEY